MQAKGNQRQETAYLEKLGEELGNRGLEAFVMAPPARWTKRAWLASACRTVCEKSRGKGIATRIKPPPRTGALPSE